ncbi:hypothetical protein GCM10020295_49710 [Streptomyces cinereospinus]
MYARIEECADMLGTHRTRGARRVQDDVTEVTAAGIARLAGVGRAAVSNWRRRHADFPRPVGGTGTSPSFALAEVESWLRRQGKLAEVSLRERVWQQLAGHPRGPVAALTHAGCALLLIHDRPMVWLEVSAGSDERLAAMLPAALEQVIVPRFGGRRVHDRAGESPGANEGTVVNAALAVHSAFGVPTPVLHIPTGPTPSRIPPPTTPRSRRPHRPRAPPLRPLLRGTAELAAELGARQAFDFLLGRHLDANPRQYPLTPHRPRPPHGGPGRPRPHRPGPRLRHRCPAARHRHHPPARSCTPRTAPPSSPRSPCSGSRCTARRPSTAPSATPCGPTPTPQVRADAVLCHPPFNERDWGA